jgi:branched-chain amino acid transport system ATP-binding protein
MTELLAVRGLSAGYGSLRVLHDIDFSIAAGERLAIVGLNGHGKTTLFRAIMQLVGWQRGSVKFDGKEIGGVRSLGEGRYTPGIVRLGIALTPQGDAIFPGLSVREHLDCGAHARSAWRERALRRERVYQLFPQLETLQDALVGKLSGGERRMVSIGRALMSDARLYLIDEPTLGLAPKVSRRVIEALVNIELAGKAMVIAEQNVAVLSGTVDRMIGMHAGRLRGEVGHVGLM